MENTVFQKVFAESLRQITMSFALEKSIFSKKKREEKKVSHWDLGDNQILSLAGVYIRRDGKHLLEIPQRAPIFSENQGIPNDWKNP